MLSNHLTSRLGSPTHGRGGNPPQGRGRGGGLAGRGRGKSNIPHHQPVETNHIPINHGGNGNFHHHHLGPGPNNPTINPQLSMYGPALSNVPMFHSIMHKFRGTLCTKEGKECIGEIICTCLPKPKINIPRINPTPIIKDINK